MKAEDLDIDWRKFTPRPPIWVVHPGIAPRLSAFLKKLWQKDDEGQARRVVQRDEELPSTDED